jgi:hypothetical protein
MKRIILILMVIGMVSGCTSLSVVRITDHEDSVTKGLRFYRPHPYLEISDVAVKDGASEKVLQYKIIWLPDLSQEYAIQINSGLGNIEFKPDLQEGWKLVGFEVKLDPKTKEIIEAITGLLAKVAAAVPAIKGPPGAPQAGIYRLDYNMNPKLDDGKPNPNYGKITGMTRIGP